MASHLGVFVEVASSTDAPSPQQNVYTIPTAPQRAKARTYHSVSHTRAASPDIELEQMQWNSLDNGSIPQTPIGGGPPNENAQFFQDVEMRGTPSPSNEHEAENGAVEALQSFSNPPMNRYRLLGICLFSFGQGLSDSAPGALLPYIEKDFKIGYAVVSLIFISNAIGFIAAAFFVDLLRSKLGRGKLMVLAQTLILCGYIPIICSGGHEWAFPVVVVSFLSLGKESSACFLGQTWPQERVI